MHRDAKRKCFLLGQSVILEKMIAITNLGCMKSGKG